DLLGAIEAVRSGVIWAPRRLISRLVDRLKTASAGGGPHPHPFEERLSLREREIFHHAARGLGNKELAAHLDISEATVKVHLTHIFQKLGVRGRSELAAAYYGIAIPAFHDLPRVPVRDSGGSSPSANDPIIRKS
ncbi:MAG: response regulator transcription factor, partial [Thermoanaerobaculia bacterium]